MSGIDASSHYYVFLCARRYAETLWKLRAEPSEDARHRHTHMLHHLMEAGIVEADLERSRSVKRLPVDLQIHIENSKQVPASRLITRSEAELVKDACSVPPVATMENLSAEEMLDLAEMYEGWAQDQRLDNFSMARLLGWADGLRGLVEAIGRDYEPPAKAPGETDSLMKFLANSMRQ